LWRLYGQTKKSPKTPSEAIGLDISTAEQWGAPHQWLCAQFDNAVHWFGRYIEGELQDFAMWDKTKDREARNLNQQRKLMKLLGDEDAATRIARQMNRIALGAPGE
jgi:hypothetical protein